jgi:hypothetical protein
MSLHARPVAWSRTASSAIQAASSSAVRSQWVRTTAGGASGRARSSSTSPGREIFALTALATVRISGPERQLVDRGSDGDGSPDASGKWSGKSSKLAGDAPRHS